MITYRPHRGSLEDAMKEVKTFLNEWQMKRYVANNWNLAIGRKVLDPEDIIIDSESTDDDRVRQGSGKPNCAHAAVRIDGLLRNVGRSGCRIIAHNTSLLVHPVYRIRKNRRTTKVQRRTKNLG